MAVYFDIKNIPVFKNAVITIGTFDGVHEGHRVILQEVVKHAKNVGGESVLLTFEPHPRKLLFPNQPLGIITPLDKKLKLVAEAGIGHVVVVPFTKEFAGMSAQEYIEQFLVGVFHPHSIIIGYDHRFGNDRKGDLKLLEKCAQAGGYELIEIPPQLIDNAAVSSTKVRHAIEEGRVDNASHMLGRSYSLRGTVAHGNKLGRTLGYPTANIECDNDEQILPARGIYAIRAVHDDTLYYGMLSIGFNPTVTDKKELKIEANLFGFDKEIYGDKLEVLFLKKLRDEQKFDTLDGLVHQLHQDKIDTLKLIDEEAD